MRQLHLLVSTWLFIFPLSAQNFDIDLLRRINLNRNEDLDPTFLLITNSVTPIELSVPVVTFATGLIIKDKDIRNAGIYLGEAVLINALINEGLKYSINRPRPFETYPDIEKLSKGGSPSFPSGHTSSAFSTATSLSIAFPKWYVIAPSYIWAGAVGYSRMHLGVHYPSDVLAGAIIGAGTAYLCYYLDKKYFKKVYAQW
jgi:membrane-associated phospholipid phosphatase